MRMSECWDATGFDPAALLVIVTVIFVRDSLVGLFSHVCLSVLLFILRALSLNLSCYLPAEIKWRQR